MKSTIYLLLLMAMSVFVLGAYGGYAHGGYGHPHGYDHGGYGHGGYDHGPHGADEGPYGSGNFAYGYWNPYLGSSVRVSRNGYDEAYNIAFKAGNKGYH